MEPVAAADTSIVREIDTRVLIPGQNHQELWNVPTIVTHPGDPITCTLAVNVADRHGKDQSFGRRWFVSTDVFDTFEEVGTKPVEPFQRIEAKFLPGPPGFPAQPGHMGTAPYVHLDSAHVIKAFTVRPDGVRNSVTSARCVLEGGNVENSRRGLYEPHAVSWRGRVFMTGRAEDGRGHLLVSPDGLKWEAPVPWAWDSGETIRMDQTMTKLLAHSDGLVLVYTRIRGDNAGTFRHRAPLHLADLDGQTLRLKRETERVIVPDRGMAVGNFWAWPLNAEESLVATAEWPRDGRPQNGDIWLCRVKWRRPNRMLTDDGRDRAELLPSAT